MDHKKGYSKAQYAEEFSGSSVEELRAEYAGMNLDEITASVNDIWPNEENNDYLAECIYHVVNN